MDGENKENLNGFLKDSYATRRKQMKTTKEEMDEGEPKGSPFNAKEELAEGEKPKKKLGFQKLAPFKKKGK